MSRFTQFVRWSISIAVIVGLAAAGWLYRDTWSAWIIRPAAQEAQEEHDHAHETKDRLKLSPQAQANLGLRTEPISLSTYWRVVQMPGTVVERPGRSSRGVSSTLAGTVTRIHAIPGQLVKPGDELFTLRLVSEYLQNIQAQLFKTARELEINTEEQKRLGNVSESQALFRTRLLELGYEERRLRAAFDTHRQDLLARGLSTEDVQKVIQGQFITELTVPVAKPSDAAAPGGFELEELKVQLGESVQPGQILAYLASHDVLDVEGKAFEQEASLLHQVAQQGLPVQVTILDATSEASVDTLRIPIRFVSNHIDPATRMLSFFVPLENTSRDVSGPQGVRRVWRFRPGQRVRLGVPVERMESVFVLPREAVAREGLDAFVFRVNGSVLERKPVYVRFEDQQHAIVANDGSVTAGNVLAMNAATALNRALKAQAEGEAGGHGHHGHEH
jgi:multidrug efflux pump subunit AcrA (membrane-fusion protein)